MKKIFYAIAAFAACISLTQCKPDDYLSVSSPNKMDDEFVTSSVSETFKTLAMCYRTYLSVAGGGNYNWNDSASDCEYYPEYNSGNGRIGYLHPENASVDSKSGQFTNLCTIIARCARIAGILEQKEEFISAHDAGQVNDWTQLWGEAWTMWAYCYTELVRHYGDVPFGLENSVVDEGYSLTSRFDILDACIAKLKEVESSMYYLGEGGIQAERMSRTFANMLIAEANMMAGGYQTIRTDVSGLYDGVSFEGAMYSNSNAQADFTRRSDWQTYYKEAQTYFRKVDSGDAKGTLSFITTDDRGLGNPYQRSLQYVMDMQVSPESIWEVGNMAPLQSERPYSQGRPSDGATKNAAPCKVFAGIRVIPTAYYQIWEDGDLRWDASAVVTGSNGKGSEAIVSLISGSRLKGGIAINKWDINKMKTPYVVACRKSGMNFAFFRLDNTMLKLAQVDLALGDSGEALTLVNRLRARAGVDALTSVDDYAIIDEFKRECIGDGDVKFAELRAGKFTELGKAMRSELKTVIAGLEADGYYTFDNGRTLSNYIWTKLVDLSGEGKAMNTYNRDESNPALTPGWRGGYDYTTTTSSGAVVGTEHNLAIEGLFEYIDPAGAEAAALEAAGYKKTDWAIGMVNEQANMWDYNMLSGIDNSDVPLYFHPIPLTTIQQSKGNVTNGYTLPNE
ncbi:MAG: RagB/SusD family nutrient uptake outer membrane protein [Bacteroidales bacterium]|nr:RagB/SusD family nutrient uptake outer membrane protein [Bacteroidales bacterium]